MCVKCISHENIYIYIHIPFTVGNLCHPVPVPITIDRHIPFWENHNHLHELQDFSWIMGNLNIRKWPRQIHSSALQRMSHRVSAVSWRHQTLHLGSIVDDLPTLHHHLLESRLALLFECYATKMPSVWDCQVREHPLAGCHAGGGFAVPFGLETAGSTGVARSKSARFTLNVPVSTSRK